MADGRAVIDALGIWSHALAALLYALLAAWQQRQSRSDPLGRPLALAFAATAAFAGVTAIVGPDHALATLFESARNFAFLAFMYGIVRSAGPARQHGLAAVYAAVGAVIGLQIVLAGVLPRFAAVPVVHGALLDTLGLIALLIAAGSLILVHNLYAQAAPQARYSLRLPALALAGMWGYDLHLYTLAHLSAGGGHDLVALRGALLALLVPIFTLAGRRSARWKPELSRAAAFRSLSLVAILAYLALMWLSRELPAMGIGGWGRAGQVGILIVLTLAAAVFVGSADARAWLRVVIAKHLFEHRYDYRGEWLGFARTIAADRGAPLGDRIVTAIAGAAGAGGGLLLTVEEDRGLAIAAGRDWRGGAPAAGDDHAALLAWLEADGRILDPADDAAPVPGWIARSDVWAGIPLLHDGRLVGLVLLAHPAVRRALDWEDFDLFRTLGTQAASYLAEARGQAALADAERFDEFNRRFAFIMHDIKNLVSQLSLVARNAERHAANPEFRADMIATLQSSVKKMNDMLARLSRERPGGDGEARVTPIDVGDLAARIVAVKARVHPLNVAGRGLALADAGALEQAIGHLVQNAIDASDPASPVEVRVAPRGDRVAIEIVDRGAGMTPDFVRTRLFQPFSSTKRDGFGIGAYEARDLVRAMGGSLEVESRPGEGSRFTILLDPAADRRLEERLVA